LPGNVARIILAATFVLFMARKEGGHSFDSGKTYGATTGQVTSTRHSTANALLAGFLCG